MATKNPDALGPTRSLKPVGDQPPEEVTNTDPGDDEEVTQILTATAARNADEPTTPNRINPLAFHLSIARENRTSLLRKLSLKSSIEPNIVAQARHASYMLIDKETAGNPANNETLSKEIAVIINSRDFITTQDDEGNIIIFALSERGGVERLFDIDESLRKANKQSKILIGECTLLQNDEGLSLLDGSLDRDTLETLHEGETAVSQSLNEKITSDQSRVGKNIKLHTSPHSNPKLVKLLDTVHLVSQELGGPDRLIGYQEELATLLNAATDDDTHIISLEGHAGHGKSRVRTEMLRLLPNSILCSINPDNKNSLGSGLVTIAEQLAEIIKQETSEIQLIPTAYEEMIGLDESDNPVYEEKAISFEQFNALTAGERIIFTTLHPETVSELCYDAMEQLRAAQNPQTLFVLEDLHHADRLSEEYLVKLIKRYADSKDGKAMVTSRPEEMYQSLAFKNLKEEEQTKNSLKVIELKGLSLLTNDTLGRNFAFYSLPPEIRKDGQGQDRKIDTWYRKLAHKAGPSPLYMKSFMDAVIPNLGIEDGTIVIKNPQVLERIDQIDPKSPTDHAVYFQERLANLDDQSRTFLQYVALMSEELGLLQIMAISKEIMGLNREGTLNLSGNLRKGGYTTDDFLRGTICKLQHESTKGIVLDSIDPKEKAVMAKKLYDQFKEDDYVSQKIKYELATIIAGNMNTKPPPDFTENFENKEFWEEYKKLVDSLFQDTTSRQDVEATRLAAQTILQIPRIKDAVATLQENAINNHHPETIRIAIDCLFNLAESSRIEGKYEETAKALDLLKNIRNQHSHLVNNLKILTIGFDSARMQNKVQEMKNLYQEMLNCGEEIPLVQRITMEILLAHYNGRNDEVEKLYQKHKPLLEEEARKYTREHSRPSAQHLEIRRICEAKAPFERIRTGNKFEGLEYDGDVISHPGALTKEDLEEMKRIELVLGKIEEMRKSYPLGFDSWAELKIMEQLAFVEAFLGKYERSQQLFSEAWRIANQMSLYESAARSAKDKGANQVLQAYLLPEEDLQGKVDLLRQALHTYTVEVIDNSLTQVDENSFYQLLARIDRIYCISNLAMTLCRQDESGENEKVQKELQTIIDLALADFKYLNTSEYCKNFSAEAEVQYYLMGHIGNILQVATDRKINLEKHLTANNNIFDPQQYPYMQLRHVEAGEAFGTGMTDLNLGKVQQTLDGLHILAERLRILQNHRLNEKRHARDGELAKDTSIPTLPRAPRAKRPIGLGSSREVAMEEWLEPPAPFIEKLEKLQALTKVNEAVEVFLAINRDHPELANDPQNAYQVIGLMGHIIRSALESGLQPDERIFDENKCLYAKISVLKAAYDFAQKVYDQGDKFAGQDIGIAEQKSAGIFTFMTILQKKEHQKKKQARAERDAAIVEKRKAS